ncbi:hypothetical protein Pyn_25590 [Prunus yedoensis var. nudiflora]|uniref:Uncharacterized protein n=1 Tax=Prunus yedoensis var. nudiflora TaxID=2094558 RepID=A0A314UWU4_PRUYE|nr:hypothetical protein Pyn_25590 [Prunus yedoensis var. nudiflora]
MYGSSRLVYCGLTVRSFRLPRTRSWIHRVIGGMQISVELAPIGLDCNLSEKVRLEMLIRCPLEGRIIGLKRI